MKGASKLSVIVLLGCLLALLLPTLSFAFDYHTKLWNSVILTGKLSAKDPNWRYYLEEDLRFVDDKYKFQQELLWYGIGYRVHPKVILYMGDSGSFTRNYSGKYIRQTTIWQQASWFITKTDRYQVISRTRMQETKRLHESQWSMLLRELLLLEIPLPHWPGHAVILSDSIFFNLKHPEWLNNNSFIQQNRAFVGIETKLSKNVSLTTGYMNQYIFSKPNQMSNILVLSIHVKTS